MMELAVVTTEMKDGLIEMVRDLSARLRVEQPGIRIVRSKDYSAYVDVIGDEIHITEGLLLDCTKVEMRAIIGHELAHMVYQHPLLLLLVRLGLFSLTIYLAVILRPGISFYLGSALVIWAVESLFRLQHEFSADALSCDVCGRYDGLLSYLTRAVGRLHALNKRRYWLFHRFSLPLMLRLGRILKNARRENTLGR